MSRTRVGLVFGGRSPEHDVSLMSARGIHDNFDPERYEVVLVGVGRDGAPRLGGAELLSGGLDRGEGLPVRWPVAPTVRRFMCESKGGFEGPEIDVFFPIIHGPGGEDGTLQGVFELAGVPYVGAGVLGSSLAMDKDLSRRVLAADGFPVVRDVVVERAARADGPTIAELVRSLGLPVFVKPARAGSSVGISIVRDLALLEAATRAAFAVDSKVVIEEAVPEAREIEVAVLGLDEPRASVAGEIEPHGEFYDYRAKYEDPESRLLIPAPIDEARANEVRELAVRAFQRLDLRGMARVDFLMSRGDGRLVLNEVNTLPGFTSISMYPRLFEASGLPYARLLEELVDLAFRATSRSQLSSSA